MQSSHVRSVRGPFSSAFLEAHLQETDGWTEVDDDELREAYDELRRRWERVRATDATGSIEERFVRPAFRILGLPFVAVEQAGEPRCRPDYAILESDAAAERTGGDASAGRGDLDAAVAIADVRSRGRDLDARGTTGDDRPAETPSHRLHVALQESAVRWGILTNGRRWRLYDASTGGRLDSYYEVDLPAILERGDLEAFRYFYCFFRREAVCPDDDGDRFLDRLAERSTAHTRSVREALRDDVYEAVTVLAGGFLAYPGNDLERSALDADDRELLYDASLAALYRLLIGLAAERRGMDLASEVTLREADGDGLLSFMRAVANARDSQNRTFGPDEDELWSRLEDRFALLDCGDLFRTEPGEDASPAIRFLAAHSVGDAALSRVIDLLTQRGDGSGPSVADYASLDVRDLGHSYERLLEYRLAIADEPLALDGDEYVPADAGDTAVVEPGEPYLTTDSGRRKATGSYYTPPSVVAYTVEQTVEPLVADVRAAAADGESEDGGSFAERFAERLFDLAVLDPAMGSGHFLLGALEYLTRELVAAQEIGARRSGVESIDPDRDVDWARRRVAQHCLYGVDLHPLAVELATASLWLRTLAADRTPAVPDQHLQSGNALVGSDLETDQPADSDALPVDSDVLDDDSFRERLEAIANVRTAERFGLECVPDDAIDRLAAALDDESGGGDDRDGDGDSHGGGTGDSHGDGHDDWDRLARTEWFTAAQRAAETDGYLHWRLAFPDRYDDAGGRRLDDPGFDAVVGNPPWVATAGRADISASLEPALRSYLADAFVTTENQFDLYVAFYERAIRLSNDGRVGFVVPDSILAREGNEPIRAFVLTETSLSAIVRIGTAFDGVETGAVIVVSGDDGSTVRCADATDGTDLESLSYDPIPTAVFEDQDEKRFRTYLDAATRDVLSTLEERPSLGEFIEISRGEEISKRADLLADNPGPDRRPIAPGAAIQRYGLDSDALRFIAPSDVAKGDDEYESPKLIFRQTGDSLVGTFDADGLATIKSAYNIHAGADGDFDSVDGLKHLLGVLNSSVLACYHYYKHAAYRTVFPQINQSTVESLPIPMADGPDAELVAAVDERLSLTAERSALLLALPEYLGDYRAGPSLDELPACRRVGGLEATKLTATTADRSTLKLGTVSVDAGEPGPVLSATVRYKPDAETVATDRWGYAETDPVPALAFTGLGDDRAALLETFVPHAVSKGSGFADFRRDATKTITPLDRLEALTLPRLADVADGLAAYREARDRAAALDARLETLDRRIDDRVCSLYGLTDAGRELVREFGDE